jgi:hypothetical protein
VGKRHSIGTGMIMIIKRGVGGKQEDNDGASRQNRVLEALPPIVGYMCATRG